MRWKFWKRKGLEIRLAVTKQQWQWILNALEVALETFIDSDDLGMHAIINQLRGGGAD